MIQGTTTAVFFLVLTATLGAQGYVQAPGLGSEASGAGITLTQLDADPRPDLLVMAHTRFVSPIGDRFTYRLCRNLSPDGVPAHDGPMIIVPSVGAAEGAGITAVDLDRNGRPELVLAGYVNQSGVRRFRYRVGRDLDANGNAGAWTGIVAAPIGDGRGNTTVDAGLAWGRIDDGVGADVVFAVCELVGTANVIRYTIAFDLDNAGRAKSWAPLRTVSGFGSTAEAGGCEVVDLDGNGRPELLLFACERTSGSNRMLYRIGWNLDATGGAQHWDPVRAVSGVGTRAQGGGIAALDMGRGVEPEILLCAYDNPPGANSFRWRTLRDANPGDPYPGSDITGSWRLLGLQSRAGPAVSGHSDNTVHVAAIDTAGQLNVRNSAGPGIWSNWTRIQGPSFDPDSEPVLLRSGDDLHLFARSSDGDLCQAIRSRFGSTWTQASKLTGDGSVAGRIDVAMTRVDNAVEVHAVYRRSGGGVVYARFAGGQQVAQQVFADALEAGIGSDGEDRVAVALRKLSQVFVHTAQRGSRWAFSLLGGRAVSGYGGGAIDDVANVVFLGGEVHVAYAQHFRPDDVGPGLVYRVNHARFRPGRNDDYFGRVITDYVPSGSEPARVRLAVYRAKVVALWTEPTDRLRFARLDSMDPTYPWVDHHEFSRGTAAGRPALAAFDTQLQDQSYLLPNHGRDLFAAVRGPGAASSVRFGICSRAVFKRLVPREFDLYDSMSGKAAFQHQPNAPTPISISQEHRPILSEIGTSLWMLPRWFVAGLFPRTVRERLCDNWKNTGRATPPCTNARLPIIVKPNGGLFVSQGAWINLDSEYVRVWEELGHYAAWALGIEDIGAGPDAAAAARSGISLRALQSAFTLFNERIGRCQSGPRCSGFTGYAGNYDASSREHSFLYTVYYYVHRGHDLRQFVDEDLGRGDSLLRRKYDWVKTNLFRGLEFGDAMTPLVAGGIQSLGTGCPGSSGRPVQLVVASGGTPRLGGTLMFSLRNAPPKSIALLHLGSSGQLWGAYRLPLDLAFLGAPGCVVYADRVQEARQVTDASGRVDVPLLLTKEPLFANLRLFSQFSVFDPFANRYGWTTSNGVVVSIATR